MKVNKIEIPKKGIIKIEIDGEVDVYTSIELKKALNEAIDKGAKKMLINLDKVTYMDSSGLGVLVAILKKIRKEQGNLKLLKLTENVKKIFEITRLTKFFEIFEEEEEAIKSFN
ncbi:MAG: hypothetical protein B6I28_01025 [Fusobacteriia bacterium 4572_132]|nr:MAG: hypothetical protein B6I28_01025 [Fusobacteriia bacterium 4572_132]